MNSTITFDNVSKKFGRSYVSESLRDFLAKPLRMLTRSNGSKSHKEKNEFWALEGVSFEAIPGEALGIIGPNGSGKSTALKLLARILKPDGGKIIVKGRVGALIELAAGFHPDLTGRDNVFLNASILGMNKEEIRKKYDQIVSFAELEEFMDMPVKWYSSGMLARLGFSVAAHLDPDVLLIDEVLSVGDMGFQQRCQLKMNSIKKKSLTTVFVSHNMSAVGTICDKVLVLNKGKAEFYGSTQEAIAVYTKAFRAKNKIQTAQVSLIANEVMNLDDKKKQIFFPGETCLVNLSFKFLKAVKKANIGISVRRSHNLYLLSSTSYYALEGECLTLHSGQEVRIGFELSLNIPPGCYVLHALVWDESTDTPLLVKEINSIVVADTQKTDGVAFLNPKIKEISYDVA